MGTIKKSNPSDVHVGSRVKMRRMMLGMSQEKLGNALGITFQQVQKYEKGANRISASRLQQIATFLQAPVSWFFEGGPAQGNLLAGPITDDPTTVLCATRDGIALARAFNSIIDHRTRAAILAVAEAAASAVTATGTQRAA